MTMRAIGDLLPAPQQAEPGNHQAALEASTGGGSVLVPPRMRGAEVVLPALPPRIPELSPDLARHVRIEGAPVPRLAEGEDPMPVVAGRVVPRALLAETEAAIARLEELLRQVAHQRTIEAWVARAVAAVGNPPEGDDGALRLAGVVSALTGEPDLCFSTESAQAAQRAWQWWPSGAEAAAFCTEVARPYRSRLEALRRVRRRIRDAAPPAPAAPKTPEAIAAVVAAARQRMAEVAASEAARAEQERLEAEARRRPVQRDQRAEDLRLAAAWEDMAARAQSESSRAGALQRAAHLRARWPDAAEGSS